MLMMLMDGWIYRWATIVLLLSYWTSNRKRASYNKFLLIDNL